VKSIEDLDSLADAEHYLRVVGGLSRSHAVAFVSRVKRIALERRRFSLFRRLRLWLALASLADPPTSVRIWSPVQL
jgi:hypothetical protein